MGIGSKQKAEKDRLSVRLPFVVNKDKGEVIDVHFQAWQPTARQVAFRYDLEAAKDVPLTQLISGFDKDRAISAVNILDHDGRRTGRTLPVTDGRFTLDGSMEQARNALGLTCP